MNFANDRSGFATADPYPTRLPDAERWLDRKEPAAWRDAPEEGSPLTQEQIERFDRDGFLVLENLFSPDEVAAVAEAGLALRGRADGIDAEDVVTEPGLSAADGPEAVRTVFRLEAHDAMMRRLSEDARLAGAARTLLGDEVYVHQSRLNYKPGFTGKEFYWHSDFETWHAEDGMPRMRAVSASLLLTDNDALNGPLMLMPGSHKTFIACQGETPDANHESSLKRQEVGVPSHDSLADMAKRCGIAPATGRAGTLVLFDCNTLHGSNGNITPFPRSNAFFVFNAVSNRLEAPFAAKDPRPGFLARREAPAPIHVKRGPLS